MVDYRLATFYEVTGGKESAYSIVVEASSPTEAIEAACALESGLRQGTKLSCQKCRNIRFYVKKKAHSGVKAIQRISRRFHPRILPD